MEGSRDVRAYMAEKSRFTGIGKLEKLHGNRGFQVQGYEGKLIIFGGGQLKEGLRVNKCYGNVFILQIGYKCIDGFFLVLAVKLFMEIENFIHMRYFFI